MTERGALAAKSGAGRVVLELAGAAGIGALLGRLLPLPPHDAFRGTLEALPVLLAGFRAIDRSCERSGGRRLASLGTAYELAALAALVLLVVARGRLGFSDNAPAEEILAGGFLLVLASRTARQLAAARPLLGEALPARPSALFFFLPLAVYLAILPWSSGHREPDGDEPFYLLVTHSLAYDLDADLTNNYAQADWRHFMSRPVAPQPGDPMGAAGERYSRHNALLPLALAPAYRLFGKRGAFATMALFAAALAWMTLRLAWHYVRGSPAEALAAYAIVAFASPLLVYSYQVWIEVPAALLVALALDRVLAFAPVGEPGAAEAAAPLALSRAWGWREWLGLGASVILLPVLKIRLMLLAVPLLALAWWRAGRRRRPVWLVAGMLALVGASMLAYNDLVYANPLKIHSWQELDVHRHSLGAYALGLSGLFYDAAFGLFAYAPIWLLLVPALLFLAGLPRRRGPRGPGGPPRALLAHLAILTAPYLVLLLPRPEWYGGWSPPFRYALVGLPLLGVALVPLLARRERPGARALVAGLAVLSLALTLLWLVVPGWTFNFADGRTYLLDHLAGRLGADVARFFPSAVRPRPATWMWPAATLVLVPLLWWLPGRRRERGGDASAPTTAVAALAGVAGLLVLAALLPIAASRLATRTIELEDPQVARTGGHQYPDRWVIDRSAYRGAWALRVGERLEAPVVPGGPRVLISLAAERVRNQPAEPFELDIAAGDLHLVTWSPPGDRTWERLDAGPFDWPAGAPLVISARGPHPPGPANGVLLDRADFEWLR